MKSFITIILFALTLTTAIGQEKYLTKNGTIAFEASVPAFEPVEAKNEAVTAILNADTGEIASLALMKGFRFRNALMEEHFNENYIESDDYPKATFKGKIIDFDKNDIKEKYSIEGTLTLHGKSKEIKVDATVSKEGDTINLSSSFISLPGDYDIKIPKIIRKKIAQEVSVSLNFALAKK